MAIPPPMVLQIVFPPSLVLTAASVLNLISSAILGVLETRGIHMKYSKFFDASSTKIKVGSRVGMLLLYTPAFLVGVASFWLFPDGDFRFLLLKSAITIHFLKRIFEGLLEPWIDLKCPGIVLFLIGISGNFYHHFLLSKLRTKGSKDYKVPKRGLFELVICPHYLFEILGFLGISLISQTLYSFSTTLGTALYLMGRSYAAKRWYISKFEDFPKE
ncbi:hypothetical protein Gotur_026067, partial [Gossypium turneri]